MLSPAPIRFRSGPAQKYAARPSESEKNTSIRKLEEYGYEVVRPQGAFYLFVKSLEPDANAFAERAKEFELLLVPGDDFGAKGYVRIAYCVSAEMIERSLPAFKALAESYGR